MKITLQLLADHCRLCEGHISVFNSKENPRYWYQIHHYQPRWRGKKGILLFEKADRLPENLNGEGIISYGKPSDKILKNNDVLWFEALPQKEQLYICLQEIILTYNSLEVELGEIIRRQGSLQELTEKAFELFGNPVVIHDQDFYQLSAYGLTDREHGWELDPSCGQYRVPYEIINDFKINADYMETMDKKRTEVFPADTFGYRILYQNLWYREEYRGRVLVNETRQPLKKSDRDLMEYFSDLVKEHFRSIVYMRNMQNHRISSLLRMMLSGKLSDPGALSSGLLYSEWTKTDDYFCAVLFPQAGDLYTHAMQYHCNLLSEKYEQSCVFEWENRIVLLLNASAGEYTVSRFQNSIAVYLRDGLMKAGISSVGNDLSEFSCYYQQAVSAYETGRQKDPTFWSYAFDRYRMDFVIQNALHSFPARFLCSPAIYQLQEYDREHSGDLLNTLRVYLFNERALLKTAEELDIHRTTLLYRIRRIEEITGIKLDDERTRFELMLSFYISS